MSAANTVPSTAAAANAGTTQQPTANNDTKNATTLPKSTTKTPSSEQNNSLTTTPKDNTTTAPPAALTTTPKDNTTTAPSAALTTTPRENTTTAPPAALTTTPKDNTATAPPAALTTTPRDNTTTAPPAALTTTPKDNTKTAPPAALTTTPKDNTATSPPAALTTTPKDNTTTAPPAALTTTPKDNTTTAPPAALTTTPKDNTTTAPPAALTTTPKDNTTTAPSAALTTTPKDNTTTAPPAALTTTPKDNTTAAQTTPPTEPSSPAPSADKHVYINEILVDKNGGFKKIELKMSTTVDVSKYVIVMVDGGTNKAIHYFNLSSTEMKVHAKEGMRIVNFDDAHSTTIVSAGTGIALYKSVTNMDSSWTVNEVDLVDALVIGTTYKAVSSYLLTTLTPGSSPFVLNPSLYGGMEYSISRCLFHNMRNTEMYALVNPSFGADNSESCNAGLNYRRDGVMSFMGSNCVHLKFPNDTLTDKLLTVMVQQVNKDCKCGITLMHVKVQAVQCCGNSLNMTFVASNKKHGDNLIQSYKKFMKTTPEISLDEKKYSLSENCDSKCCDTSDKKKNIKITVGVVVACIAVFAVIVVCVVLYLRRKKTAVYQFRMSRLQEDEDDLIDGRATDDFIGGQEAATFDLKE